MHGLAERLPLVDHAPDVYKDGWVQGFLRHGVQPSQKGGGLQLPNSALVCEGHDRFWQ